MPRVLLALTFLVSAAVLSAQESVPFEVASVKRSPTLPPGGAVVHSGSPQPGGRWIAQNARFMDILRAAFPEFGLRGQIVGGPTWINAFRFDITARAESEAVSSEALRAMAKRLLADRFQLRVHTERRALPVHALIIARSDGRLGPRLRPVNDDCRPTADPGARISPQADERPRCGAAD